MAAVEKWAGFGGRQLFSERTQLYGFFALRSEDRFQPVSDGQHHRLNFSKMNDRNGVLASSGSQHYQSVATVRFHVV
jgi:hypothetical protein